MFQLCLLKGILEKHVLLLALKFSLNFKLLNLFYTGTPATSVTPSPAPSIKGEVEDKDDEKKEDKDKTEEKEKTDDKENEKQVLTDKEEKKDKEGTEVEKASRIYF